MILSGGSKQRYVYANDPSKVFTLNVSDSTSQWRDDKIPEMLGNRMWHGCTLANIDNEVSEAQFLYFYIRTFLVFFEPTTLNSYLHKAIFNR